MGDEDAIGKTIYVNNVPFTVIGVMKKKMQMSMYGGPDADKATIPESTFKALYGRRYVSRIIYQVNQTDKAKLVKNEIFRILGKKHKFHKEDEKTLWMWDTINQTAVAKNILVGLQIFLGFIGTLTLTIAGVGVANIMFVTVKRRTREIGIKRALGGRRRDIMRQFIIEALLIDISGGAIGAVIAFAIIQILQLIPVNNEALQFLGKPVFSTSIALSTALILGFLGLLSGYFPARRAAAVDPIEALHYE